MREMRERALWAQWPIYSADLFARYSITLYCKHLQLSSLTLDQICQTSMGQIRIGKNWGSILCNRTLQRRVYKRQMEQLQTVVLGKSLYLHPKCYSELFCYRSQVTNLLMCRCLQELSKAKVMYNQYVYFKINLRNLKQISVLEPSIKANFLIIKLREIIHIKFVQIRRGKCSNQAKLSFNIILLPLTSLSAACVQCKINSKPLQEHPSP